MCSKLTIKRFIVNFEHISHLVLVFLLLTLNMQLPAGLKLYLRLSSEAMADKEIKRGRCKYRKFEYLESKKSFLDETKIIFHNGYHLVKK